MFLIQYQGETGTVSVEGRNELLDILVSSWKTGEDKVDVIYSAIINEKGVLETSQIRPYIQSNDIYLSVLDKRADGDSEVVIHLKNKVKILERFLNGGNLNENDMRELRYLDESIHEAERRKPERTFAGETEITCTV